MKDPLGSPGDGFNFFDRWLPIVVAVIIIIAMLKGAH